LLAQAIGSGQEHLLARPEQEITPLQYDAYLESVSRRAQGEPLQHITGHQEFYGLDFVVSPDVLIPRPETEFLVDQILNLLKSSESSAEAPAPAQAGSYNDRPHITERQEGPLIVDVGTGSGCIAIAVAVHLQMSPIIATDISQRALEVARRNAAIHGVSDRINFIAGDLLSPLDQQELEGQVDLIACNPPYIPSDRPDLVQRDVRDFEPAAALYAGPDGLTFYRRLLVDALEYLRPGGHMVFEIGYSQLDSVRAMIDESRWEFLHLVEDLQGIPRTLTLRRR